MKIQDPMLQAAKNIHGILVHLSQIQPLLTFCPICPVSLCLLFYLYMHVYQLETLCPFTKNAAGYNYYFLFFLKMLFIFFLERKGGRGRETSMCDFLSRAPFWGPTTQACALTGNRTSNPLIHRSALSHTSQGPGYNS